jgi:carbamoyltransferase
LIGQPQYILGVSAYYHDASAALLCDGVVVAAIAEERLSHIRHDASFPEMAIEWCLAQAGIVAEQLTALVYYEDSSVKFSRILVSALADFPRGFFFFAGAMKRWLPEQLWIKARICNALEIHPKHVLHVSHHLSHTSHAFFNSPYERAAVITVDAVGEWTCSSIAKADRTSATPLELVYEQTYPSSVGLFYAAMTAFLGFQPNSDECSTMALAAYGKPVYYDDLLKILRYDVAKPGYLDLSALDINTFSPEHFSKTLQQLLGPSRHVSQTLGFSWQQSTVVVDANAQRYADIASSVQAVLETVLVDLVERAIMLTGLRQFCISGGVANNCVAIGKLVRKYGEQNVFVPVDPGDAGSAVGAAMAGYFRLKKQPAVSMQTPYIGKPPDANDIKPLLERLSQDQLSQGRAGTRKSLVWREVESETELLQAVVQRLHTGKLVGWVNGRNEFGPRALGARSILAHPADRIAVQRLSERVKLRAAFRPYGISLTEEYARIALQVGAAIPEPARWMQMTLDVREDYRASLACAVAVDGSTRPQVCSEKDTGRFYRLLKCFGEKEGVEALINTSFNEPGYPMVTTALDALTAFLRMQLDVLVIDNILVEKLS